MNKNLTLDFISSLIFCFVLGSCGVVTGWEVQMVLQEEVEDHPHWRPSQDQSDPSGAARAAVAIP